MVKVKQTPKSKLLKAHIDSKLELLDAPTRNCPITHKVAFPEPVWVVRAADSPSDYGFDDDDNHDADDDADDSSSSPFALSEIVFRYKYGLRTAKWNDKVDERRFARIPFVPLAKLTTTTVFPPTPALLPPPPPPPQKVFVRRDGTMVIVTVSGDLYPPNLELRLDATTTTTAAEDDDSFIIPSNIVTATDAAMIDDPACDDVGPFRDSYSRRETKNDSNGGYVNSGYDRDNVDVDVDLATGVDGSHDDDDDDRARRNDVGVPRDDNDDDGDDGDGVSSWDEESDEESALPPPASLDVSRVELIGACPYCNLSFVGPKGKILGSVLRRLDPGNEAEFVEEHIDRCCLRQHTGQLVKCSVCEKSYRNHPRKERNHWAKYHPEDQIACPFEQCSSTPLLSDGALEKHLTFVHYWSMTKISSYVSNVRKKRAAKKAKKTKKAKNN